MRLQLYINESVPFDKIRSSTYVKGEQDKIDKLWKSISKDCKYYLSLTKGLNFYRGMTPIDDEFGKKSVRKDREPYGMNSGEAKNLNKWLVKNGHADRSKSVMANGNIHHTTLFGDPYVIFPIGRFNYTWINHRDINIYDDIDEDEMYSLNLIMRGKIENEDIEWYNIAKKMFTTNKGIKIAHKKQYEIWFDCNAYYYMKPIYLRSRPSKV